MRTITVALVLAFGGCFPMSAPTTSAPPPQQPYPPYAQPQPYPQQQPPPVAQPQPGSQPSQVGQTQPPPPVAQPGAQPQPGVQPSPYPQYPPPAYPQPPYGGPQPVAQVTAAPTTTRVHDGEVIGDFAAVGTLAAVDVLVRQDVDSGVGTMLVFGGMVGGAAGGWLLTEKYKIDEGSARATTIGLLVGAANGALLIEPTGWDQPSSVLGLLFFGSAIGAGGGFIYGQAADLTGGQATFIGNVTILGTATAALGAIAGSSDDKYGSWENGTLALGLDAGLVAGALIAPKLDWSKRRSRITLAASGVGALVGGMVAGLATNKKDGSGSTEHDGDLVATCMTAGMWGGFGLGILMTRDSAPDPKLAKPATAATMGTSYAPWVADGQLGVMAAGSW